MNELQRNQLQEIREHLMGEIKERLDLIELLK